MSGSSSVPRPTWTSAGFTVPAEAEILAGINADLNAAFGGRLNQGTTGGSPTNPTPQGQLASSFAAVVGNKDATFLYYSQQVDPAFALGRMQDGIARIYFITRLPALPTVVTATCSGAVSLVIPTGAQARATDGTVYVCTAGGEITADGTVDLQFASTINGPIACPPGSLNRIYRTINGWDAITNAAAGVLGVNEEGRAAFEERRGQSVAKNSIGGQTSILGSVLGVAGVLDAYVRSNDTSVTATIGGISVPPNALYVAVTGGDDQDIGEAIWLRKMPGGPYYPGNTTVTVLDDRSGYSLPLPSYTVKFHRPTPTPIIFSVSIVDSVSVPFDALSQIQAAIIGAFAGADGGQRARIGSTIHALRFAGPIVRLGNWAQLDSIQVGTGTAAEFTASIAAATLTVTAVASGTLEIGQLITGSNVAQGTHILALGTGTGGVGTYTVGVVQTLTSRAMASVALGNSVVMNMDQVPVTSPANINLTLV